MANPFELKGKRNCFGCSDEMLSGDMVFFHDDHVLCESCADDNGIVCECGNYKKEEYQKCYTCFQEERTDGMW